MLRARRQPAAAQATLTPPSIAVDCLAKELAPQGLTAILLHPGHVRTDMGDPAAPVTPQQSVAGMKGVIDKLTPEDNGRFLSCNGTALPW